MGEITTVKATVTRIPEYAGLKTFLMQRVEKRPDGCWLWTGCQRGNGYAAVNIGGKTHSVHRVMYMLEHNLTELETKKLVCHICKRRWCVFPGHMYLGNHKTNMMDLKKQGSGTVNDYRKEPFTEEEEIAIRVMYQRGTSKNQLMKEWKIHYNTLCRILRQETRNT